MKIVIQTQVRENYGSADNPYWKFKGGNIYVVPNLTVDQAKVVKDGGIPTLTKLLEVYGSMFEEYIAGWYIADDGDKVCEPWDTPFELFWRNGRWIANRTIDNGEYGYMNSAVERKTEEYDMQPGGVTSNYRAIYTMRNGDIVNASEVNNYLARLEVSA
jgi:hypothetical protein